MNHTHQVDLFRLGYTTYSDPTRLNTYSVINNFITPNQPNPTRYKKHSTIHPTPNVKISLVRFQSFGLKGKLGKPATSPWRCVSVTPG